jgi:hypothetical protein
MKQKQNKITARKLGINPRALGINPRALGINPKLLETDPKTFIKNVQYLNKFRKEADKNRKGY